MSCRQLFLGFSAIPPGSTVYSWVPGPSTAPDAPHIASVLSCTEGSNVGSVKPPVTFEADVEEVVSDRNDETVLKQLALPSH